METEPLLSGSINQSTDYGSQFEEGQHGELKGKLGLAFRSCVCDRAKVA